MKSVISLDEIKEIIKQSVKETVSLEMMKIRAELLHYISDREQKEIDDLYGNPGNTAVEKFKVNI